MLRKKLLVATMASVLALGGVGAALAANHKAQNGDEKAAVQAAKVSLTQAIAAAEQHAKGRAIAIDLEREKGALRYEVLTVVNGKPVTVLVDIATGSVIGTEREGYIARMFDREDKADIAQATKATTTLAAAITAAETSTSGKAIEGGFHNENGKPIYEIKVLKDGKFQRVKVDAASGKVLSTTANGDDDNEQGDQNEHED